MNRRILVSVMVIGLVGALAGSSTMALFNDSETSSENQFTAGELDLLVDWEESYNGEHVETQELTNDPGSIFDFEDIKPGDHGEATISLHLEDNPGWIWMNLNQTSNWDNACTEPEREAEGQCGSVGELDEYLEFTIWADDGDNVLQEDEKVIFEGTAQELEEKSEEGVLLDGNPSTNETEAFPGEETGYIGVKWNLPLETGNIVQGDSLSYDINFYTEQERHNDNPDNPWGEVDNPDNNETDDNETDDNETDDNETDDNETDDNETDDNGSDPEHPDNETPVDDNESEDIYYQVDLVGGEPIENLSESTYTSEGRMQRYMHGGPENPVDNESEPDQVKTGTGGPDCVDSEPFAVDQEENTASVDFEIHNITPECATDTELSLVSYEKPYPGWIADRAGEQEIFDSDTERFEPGNYSMTIDLPDVRGDDSGEPQTCEEPENSSMEYSADEIAQAKYGYDFEDLSGETTCEVKDLFNNQPFADGLALEDVMTKDEIAEDEYGESYAELDSDSQSSVDQTYMDQFADEEASIEGDLTFNDQTVEDGEVTINNVSTTVDSTVYVTYEDGSDTVIAGIHNAPADLDNFDPMNVEINDSGVPGEYTARMVEKPISVGYSSGDVLQESTLEKQYFSQSAQISAEEETSAEATATQGDSEVELEALSGDIPVEELYDFRLPDSYDNEADNNETNGATYPGSGPYYQSVGTEDLQEQETSIMFLYDGPEGLSLVVVHDKAGGDGGSATFEISGLDSSGEWVVKDDLYRDSDGSKASSNYDIWDVSSDPQTIDWTWGSGGTDGGVFSPLSEDFSFTIDPAFNEDSELYEQFYNGEIDEWQVLSGEMDNPDRTTLDMEEEVTVSAQ